IFEAARKIESLNERDKCLVRLCRGDTQLRERVAKLLRAADQDVHFLESPPSGLADDSFRIDGSTTIDREATERPGSAIGPYKLLEQIGEGGFGVVFLAEQERPVRRKVALKIIKPGMDTRQVIARFEAERQVLAMMDHPNIAKVHDAGTTENGRPYFVM